MVYVVVYICMFILVFFFRFSSILLICYLEVNGFFFSRGIINLRKILVNRLMILKFVKRRKILVGELVMILLI